MFCQTFPNCFYSFSSYNIDGATAIFSKTQVNYVNRKDVFSFQDRILKCQNNLVKCITMSNYFISCRKIQKGNELKFRESSDVNNDL